jgi:hypothetical protein
MIRLNIWHNAMSIVVYLACSAANGQRSLGSSVDEW